MPRSEFERGYRAALRHVIAMRVQYWPDEAQPSIDKFIAQIRNCIRRKASSAKLQEDKFQALMSQSSKKVKR